MSTLNRYTKARPLRPWIISFIQHYDFKEKATTSANAVKIIECVSGPDNDGDLVRQVTDGNCFLKAILTGEAVRSCMEEYEDDMPSWDKALVLMRKYHLKFEPNSILRNCEFILIVEEFKLWDLQSGFDFKNSIHPCMNNKDVKSKLEVHWKKWRETMLHNSEASMNGDSMIGSQMLSLLAEMGQATQPDDDTDHILEQNVVQHANVSKTESVSCAAKYCDSLIDEPHAASKIPLNMTDVLCGNQIDNEQPSTSRQRNIHVTENDTTPKCTYDKSEIEDYYEEYVFDSPSVVSLQFSCESSIEEENNNFNDKKSEKKINNPLVKQSEIEFERDKDCGEMKTKPSLKELKENADVDNQSLQSTINNVESTSTMDSNKMPIKCNIKNVTNDVYVLYDYYDVKSKNSTEPITVLQADDISDVNFNLKNESLFERNVSSNAVTDISVFNTSNVLSCERITSDVSLRNISSTDTYYSGTQPFVPLITENDTGTQPFTIKLSPQNLNQSSDTSIIEPNYQLSNQDVKYASNNDSLSGFEKANQIRNCDSVTTCEPSQEMLFSSDSKSKTSNSNNSSENYIEKSFSSYYQIRDYNSNVSDDLKSLSVESLSATDSNKNKNSNSSNGHEDVSTEVYQSTQKADEKEKPPKFLLSPIQTDKADSRHVVSESLMFDIEYEEDNRLKQLAVVCRQLNKPNNKILINTADKSNKTRQSLQTPVSNKLKLSSKNQSNKPELQIQSDKASDSELLMISATRTAECSSPKITTTPRKSRIKENTFLTYNHDSDSLNSDSVLIIDCQENVLQDQAKKNRPYTDFLNSATDSMTCDTASKKTPFKLQTDSQTSEPKHGSYYSSESMITIHSISSDSLQNHIHEHSTYSRGTYDKNCSKQNDFHNKSIEHINQPNCSRDRSPIDRDECISSSKSQKKLSSPKFNVDLFVSNSKTHTVRKSPRILAKSSKEILISSDEREEPPEHKVSSQSVKNKKFKLVLNLSKSKVSEESGWLSKGKPRMRVENDSFSDHHNTSSDADTDDWVKRNKREASKVCHRQSAAHSSQSEVWMDLFDVMPKTEIEEKILNFKLSQKKLENIHKLISNN